MKKVLIIGVLLGSLVHQAHAQDTPHSLNAQLEQSYEEKAKVAQDLQTILQRLENSDEPAMARETQLRNESDSTMWLIGQN